MRTLKKISKDTISKEKNKFVKTKKNTTSKYGGRVVASGGYGCIFRPALKCKNVPREKNQISKLMVLKNINEEYNDIVKFKPFLEKIPNYQNYFFIDNVYTCKPEKLTKSDLKDYEKKCRALKKSGIYKNNINSSLDKLGLLNMPDGGLDVGDFIETIKEINQYIKLNNSLIDLLLNGIIPMNSYNIYHGDIKESNILVSTTNNFKLTNNLIRNSDSNFSGSIIDKEINTSHEVEDLNLHQFKTKLIDWGLSSMFDGKTIPRVMINKPFQYNLPFSVIFFNDVFKDTYKKMLQNNENPSYFDIRAFVIDYVFLWNDKRGAGHIKYMINVMNSLFENDLNNINIEIRKEIIEMEFLYYYIIEYLTKVLIDFTKNGKFMEMDYFTKVFLKNVDVWGLVMSYYPIINVLHINYKSLNKSSIELFKKLKYIFIHFLFENPTEPINLEKLVKNLKELNSLFKMTSNDNNNNNNDNNKNDNNNNNKNGNRKKKEKSILSLTKTSAFRKNTSQNKTTKNKPRTIVFIESNK